MTTVGKVAIGAAVVIGGVVVYKMVTKPDPVRVAAKSTASSTTAAVNGFLNLGTSVLNYFTRKDPAPSAVSTSKWDSSADLQLPDLPGGSTWDDSARDNAILG